MSSEGDALLKLARDVAEGGNIDWQQRRSELHEDLEAVQVAKGLQRLAAVQRHFRTAARAAGAPSDTSEQAATETRGWLWGHLEVGSLVGSGSFGEVYRAYDPVLHRTVALKLRAASHAIGEHAFLAEARRLAQVRHANVLAVHGADVHAGRAGLWSDLLEGTTLESELEARGALAASTVLDIARQLAEALAAVHAAGIVHGDVKASNVMLEPGGRAVLMDFGAGSDAEQGSGPKAAAGSPLSMAPELFSGGAASYASDLYSLGVLLARLLTARYPVHAQTLEELEQQHRQGAASHWSNEFQPPRGLRQLVDRLLATDPEQRPTAPELVNLLRDLEERPQRRRRRLAVATTMVSLFLALTASSLGWLFSSRATQRANTARIEAEANASFLGNLLLAPDITQQGPDVRVVDVLGKARELATTTLADRPLLQGRIWWLIGRVRASLGQGEEALEIFHLAESAFATASEDRSSREGIEVQLRRSRLLVELGRHDEAQQALDQTEIPIEQLGQDDRLRFLWLRGRGFLRSERGEMDGAEEDYRRVLQAGEQRMQDPELAQVPAELAVVLEMKGELAEAEPLYRQTLDWSLEVNGARHDRTLATRHNLAGLLARLGRYDEAEPLFRLNAETAKDWLGQEHRYYLSSLSGLTNVLGDLGRLEEAIQLDEEALPLAETSLGAEHPRTQIMRMNAANRQTIVGRLASAEALLLPAVEILEAKLGADSPPTLHAQMLVSQIYLDDARPAEAATVAEPALERARSSLGNDSPVTLALQTRLGRAWTELGQAEASVPLLRDSLQRHESSLGNESVETIYTQISLAEALQATGVVAEAQEQRCTAEQRLLNSDVMQGRLRSELRGRLAEAGGCAQESIPESPFSS